MFDLNKFHEEHCKLCGTQRCGGVKDELMREGCPEFKREINKTITLSEFAEYCKSIDINCDICVYQIKCRQMLSDISEISPYGLVKMVKENKQY